MPREGTSEKRQKDYAVFRAFDFGAEAVLARNNLHLEIETVAGILEW